MSHKIDPAVLSALTNEMNLLKEEFQRLQEGPTSIIPVADLSVPNTTCSHCLECQKYYGPCGFCNSCVDSGLAPDNYCRQHDAYSCGGGKGEHKKFLVSGDHYPVCKVMGCNTPHPSDRMMALADLIEKFLPAKSNKRKSESKKKKKSKHRKQPKVSM